jgi:uncharacterized membrane protein YesL
MGKIFDLDSPLMRALTKLADVMWVNILTLLFALPLILEQLFFFSPFLFGDMEFQVNIVVWAWLFGMIFSIPLGPALTGMHFVLLKIVRDEESYITKTFFKSFKENLKQGIILQLIQFGIFGILLLDYLFMTGSGIYRYLVMAIALILYLVSLYIFPLLSKFVNTVFGTIKNAILMSVLALPRTVAMGIITLVPFLILYFFDIKAIPILILMGIAGPAYLCAMLYNATFKRFEPKVEEMSEEEELEAAISKIDAEEDGQKSDD